MDTFLNNDEVKKVIYAKCLDFFFDGIQTTSFLSNDFCEKVYVVKNDQYKQFNCLEDFFWYLVKEHSFSDDKIFLMKNDIFNVFEDEELFEFNDGDDKSNLLSSYFYLTRNTINDLIEKNLLSI